MLINQLGGFVSFQIRHMPKMGSLGVKSGYLPYGPNRKSTSYMVGRPVEPMG